MHTKTTKRRSNVFKVSSSRSTSKTVFVVIAVFGLCGLNIIRRSTGSERGLASVTSYSSGTTFPNDWNSIWSTKSTVGHHEWKTSAYPCKNAPVELEDGWHKSQSEEDEELLQWFSDICGGTYLEMGGLDGLLFSNSYVFNRGLSWKGVLIEASPSKYSKLIKNRPNEIATVHAGACQKSMDLHWVENPDKVAVGGFLEFAATSFQKQFWTEEAIQNAQVVKCKPLKDILQETVGPKFFFDFFSLDVEGAEHKVISSIDFDQVGFGIVLVEADEHNELKNMAVRTLFESNGYIFLREHSRSYWFVNRDFASIYEDLVYAK